MYIVKIECVAKIALSLWVKRDSLSSERPTRERGYMPRPIIPIHSSACAVSRSS